MTLATAALGATALGIRLPIHAIIRPLSPITTRVTVSWSLSGLVYAGLWALAPIPVAVAGGSAAIIAGIAVTVGYCMALRARTRRATLR